MKQQVTDVCSLVPPEAGDPFPHICHRVEWRVDGKTRPVIIRFVARSTKELIWKKGKGSKYLSTKRLRFGEDLTAKDKEARHRLWPQIEAARKEGKKAFFRGGQSNN